MLTMLRKRRSATVLTLTVAAMSLFAAACSSGTEAPGGTTQAPGGPSSSGGSSPAGGAPAAQAGKPRYGGVMNVVMANPTNFMNPFLGVGAVSGNVIHEPLLDGLLEYNPDKPSEIIPALAESWSSQDGQTYVFKLRKDVTWHDGKPFTAADVVATFDYMQHLDTLKKSPRQGGFLRDIGATWRAVDPLTLEVKLKAPNATFIGWVAAVGEQIGSKHIIERYGGPKADLTEKDPKKEDVVGTGPYKLVKHDRDVETIFERNPNYWKKDAAGNKLPFMDGLHVYLIRDSALQLAAFRTNQVDMWPGGYPIVLKSDADSLKAQLGDKISITPGNASLQDHFYLANHSSPFFKQRDFRWAVHLITDRQEMAQRGAEGNFLIGMLDPEIQGPAALPMEELLKMPGFRQPKTEDFAEARRLLEKMGITPQKPVEIRIVSRNYGFPMAMAQILAKQLEPFGIKSRLDIKELAAASTDVASGNFDMNPDIDGMPAPDPYFLLALELDWGQNPVPGCGQPHCVWDGDQSAVDSAKKIRSLLEEAVRTIDDAKRNALYREIQRYVFTVDTPNIIVGFERTYNMWWNVVKGYKIVGGVYEGLRYERAWLER